jgi:hypothetical protein
MTSSADIITGRCAVWALPHTPACAEVARRTIHEALGPLLPPRLVNDCAIMASELATNGFVHGLRARNLDDQRAPAAGRSEVAIYRRGSESTAELVITVFDPRPDLDGIGGPTWNPLASLPDKPLDESLPDELLDKLLSELPDEPLPEALSPEVVHGLHPERWSGRRGLDTVRVLSNGNCGFYRTTSRLGKQPVSGKAAWFAVPLAPGSLAAPPQQIGYSPAEAIKRLSSQLAARGIDHMIQNHLHDRSLLSLRHTTVWSDTTVYSWGGAQRVRLTHSDLTEAVEQLVRIHEDREYSPLRTSL